MNFIKKLFGIHIHDWAKWRVFNSESWTHYYKSPGQDMKSQEYIRNGQERFCKACGLKQKMYFN